MAAYDLTGLTLGRYRIQSKLGQGGMATVWKAEDTLLRRPVALKVLAEGVTDSPDAEQRFMREARAAFALDHPSTVAVYDVGRDAGRSYIAFACIDGETVSDRAARTPLRESEVIALGIAVADALAHAHARGIVHRDITGRNVMVDRDGRFFVLDFGLARIAGLSRLTSSRVAIGTVAYMSPEVAGGGAADEQSDLYGLGVVLYEALTGVLPFRGETPATLLYAILNMSPEPPSRWRPGIRPAIERAILGLIEKQPTFRPASAADLVLALRALEAQDSEAAADPLGVPPGPLGARHEASGEGLLPGRPYLAVLPFEDAGSADDPGDQRAVFAQGLAGALDAALARWPEIHIVPVPSPLPADPTADPEGLARMLGANLLLRGMVRRAGSAIRVSYSLVHPYRRVQAGGGTVEGTTTDLFDLEDRLVGSVVASLELEPGSRHPWPEARPRDPAARERFVQAIGYLQRYENEAHVDAALALLERLAASDPGSAPVHAARGRGCLAKYRLTSERSWQAQAATHCQHALELDPNLPEVLTTLGDLDNSGGRYREAIEHYQRALAAREEHFEALLGIARAYEGLERFADAESWCHRAIAARPGYWGGYNALGLILMRQGRFEECLEPWRKVVALTPDNYRGYQNLGAASFNLARYDDALMWSQQSLEVHPDAPAYSNVGTILYFDGRYEEAARALRRATDLRPSDPVLWGNLGGACLWVPALRGEGEAALEKAVSLMRERLDRNPNAARDWIRAACWLANLGRHDEARSALDRGLALGPEEVTALAYAGVIRHQAGDREGALRFLRDAVRRGYRMDLLTREPFLAGLHEDPEFRSLSELTPDAGTMQHDPKRPSRQP